MVRLARVSLPVVLGFFLLFGAIGSLSAQTTPPPNEITVRVKKVYPEAVLYCSGGSSCEFSDYQIHVSGSATPVHNWNGPGGVFELDMSDFPGMAYTSTTVAGVIGFRVHYLSVSAPTASSQLAYNKKPYGSNVLTSVDASTFGTKTAGDVICYSVAATAPVNFDGACDQYSSTSTSARIVFDRRENFPVTFSHTSFATGTSHAYDIVIDYVEVVYNGVYIPDPETTMPGTHPGGGGGFCTFTTTLPFSSTEQLTTTLGITSTAGITITPGVGGGISATIPYTRNINLVKNDGFESGNPPTNWEKYKDATILSGSWSNLVDGAGFNESRAAQGNSGAFDFLQNVSFQGTGATYAMGFHARCLDESNCSSASIYFGQMVLGGNVTPPIATGSPISTTYTQISGTKTIGGGAGAITIKTNGSNVYIDDVFVYAVDGETGEPLCAPELYEPGPGGAGDDSGDGNDIPPIIVPSPGGGGIPIGGGLAAKCYDCTTPSNFFSIGSWIAWLVCHLRNLFTCQLRIWIYNVQNLIMGFFRAFWLLLLWLPSVLMGAAVWAAGIVIAVWDWVKTQALGAVVWAASQISMVWTWVYTQAANGVSWANGLWQGFASWLWIAFTTFIVWLGAMATNTWGWVTGFVTELWRTLAALPGSFIRWLLESSFVQMIWTRLHMLSAIWDIVKVLIDAFMNMMRDLFHMLIRFLEMLINLFRSVRDAFTANPYEITIQTPDGEVSTINAGALYAPGPNGTKILWLFLAGIGTIDWFVGEFNLGIVLMMVVGSLAIGLIFWTLKLWHDILPI